MRTLVGVLTIGLSSMGCTSAGNGKDGDSKGTCDRSTSNITASGFADSPITVSGVTPQTDVLWENGEFTGVNFFMAGSTAALRVILDSHQGTPFAAGDDVPVGDDPVLQIEGAGTAGHYYLCHATSGEANVDVLSVEPGSAPPALGAAHIRFDAMCATDSALPAGTTDVSGCFNYPGL
jgi:hypothetical protein